MNIKVDEIIIQPTGFVYINLTVPKKRSIINYIGKFKEYVINEQYRIKTDGKKIFIELHCGRDGWDSYPNPTYDKIKDWWKENKNKVVNNTIETIQKI